MTASKLKVWQAQKAAGRLDPRWPLEQRGSRFCHDALVPPTGSMDASPSAAAAEAPAAPDAPSSPLNDILAVRLSLKQALNVVQKQEGEIKRLKEAYVKLSQRGEAEEEFITNKLLKRLEQLKKEKEKLAMYVCHARRSPLRCVVFRAGGGGLDCVLYPPLTGGRILLLLPCSI